MRPLWFQLPVSPFIFTPMTGRFQIVWAAPSRAHIFNNLTSGLGFYLVFGNLLPGKHLLNLKKVLRTKSICPLASYKEAHLCMYFWCMRAVITEMKYVMLMEIIERTLLHTSFVCPGSNIHSGVCRRPLWMWDFWHQIGVCRHCVNIFELFPRSKELHPWRLNEPTDKSDRRRDWLKMTKLLWLTTPAYEDMRVLGDGLVIFTVFTFMLF